MAHGRRTTTTHRAPSGKVDVADAVACWQANRIANYESSNDAYVVEDYGFGCLIENVEVLPEAA